MDNNLFDEKPNFFTFDTNFTHGGLIIHRDSRPEEASYFIHECCFDRNNNSRTHGLGGGLSLLFRSSGNSIVSITHCEFYNNEAGSGGGMIVTQTNNSSNVININHTHFDSNLAHSQGGGIYITNRAKKNTNLKLIFGSMPL